MFRMNDFIYNYKDQASLQPQTDVVSEFIG